MIIIYEGKRILIVEDDQEISRLLSVILEKTKMETVAAFSGTEGLLQLQNNSFDLILLDLMLPGKSGEELIKEIREKSVIPIIVISAKIDIENKVQVLKMGAFRDFIVTGGGARIDFGSGYGNLLTASNPIVDNTLQVWSAAGKAHMEKSPGTLTVYAIGHFGFPIP